MIRSTILGALVLLSAFASADPFLINVNHSLSDGVVMDPMLMSQQNLDGSGGGTSWPYSFSSFGNFDNPFEQNTPVGTLSMLGLYTAQGMSFGDPSTSGVSFLINGSAAAGIVGKSWNDIFPTYSLADIRLGLTNILTANGDQGKLDAGFAVLDPFMQANKNLFLTEGEFGSFVGFEEQVTDSRNFGVGQWTAKPVPEPGTMLALGLGGAMLLRRRRRLV